MSIDSLAHAFLRISIFQGLKPEQLDAIARAADRIVFQSGQYIIEMNKPGDMAYLLISGDAVRISNLGETSAAEVLTQGSLIAEMMMLVESHHTSTVVARDTVRALGISRTALREVMLDDPKIAEHFTRIISARLLTLSAALKDVDQGLLSSVTALDACRHPDQVPERKSQPHDITPVRKDSGIAVH